MKNSQIASKSAKHGIGVASIHASAKEAAKVGCETTDSDREADPDLRRILRSKEYLRSERREVAVGSEFQDWGEAELEVLRMLSLDNRLNSVGY